MLLVGNELFQQEKSKINSPKINKSKRKLRTVERTMQIVCVVVVWECCACTMRPLALPLFFKVKLSTGIDSCAICYNGWHQLTWGVVPIGTIRVSIARSKQTEIVSRWFENWKTRKTFIDKRKREWGNENNCVLFSRKFFVVLFSLISVLVILLLLLQDVSYSVIHWNATYFFLVYPCIFLRKFNFLIHFSLLWK